MTTAELQPVTRQAELLHLITQWDGDSVVTRFDQPTGTWIFIALHSHLLGQPTGGTRMKVYDTPAAALYDAMRLAEAMTWKWAGVGMAYGGGKAVLAVPHPLDDSQKTGLFERYGDLIESLRGAFAGAADLGTGPWEMGIVATRTKWVHGFDRDGSSLDPGPFTAVGVRGGIRGALGHVFGERSLAGRVILVEGLGGVGGPLVRLLAEDGARLILADLDQDKADRLARELGAETMSPGEVASTHCDVYAPCAVGATLNAETILRLNCQIVAGSANNQLAEDADADRLAKRDICYVPDYIINAGGAMGVCLLEEGNEPDVAHARVAGIEDTVFNLLARATSSGMTPLEAAREHVEATLRAAKANGKTRKVA